MKSRAFLLRRCACSPPPSAAHAIPNYPKISTLEYIPTFITLLQSTGSVKTFLPVFGYALLNYCAIVLFWEYFEGDSQKLAGILLHNYVNVGFIHVGPQCIQAIGIPSRRQSHLGERKFDLNSNDSAITICSLVRRRRNDHRQSSE